MEYLIEEEQVANKKLKKIVKFSRVFDVATVAELLKTELPDDVVNIFKKYSEPNCDESVGKGVVAKCLNSDSIVLDKMAG